ncbi:MAG: EamA family transporter [Eubacteriales bacterium]|nr:EamA family transporter [Eubacteriales bacterium]
MSKKTVAYLELIAAGVSWGFIGLFTRHLSAAGIGADNIAALRCVGSALFLACFFALTDRDAFRITKKDIPLHFGNGVLSTLGSAYFYMYCQTECSLAVAGILLYTAPAVVVILSVLILKEPLTKSKSFALFLTMLGCALVSGFFGGEQSCTLLGLLYGLGSGITYGLYSIFSHYLLRRNGANGVTMWSYLFAAAAAPFLIHPDEIALLWSSASVALNAVGLVFFGSLLPALLYTKGMEHVEASRAQMIVALEPAVAALVGIFVFGEPMSAAVFAGLGCIIASICILR